MLDFYNYNENIDYPLRVGADQSPATTPLSEVFVSALFEFDIGDGLSGDEVAQVVRIERTTIVRIEIDIEVGGVGNTALYTFEIEFADATQYSVHRSEDGNNRGTIVISGLGDWTNMPIGSPWVPPSPAEFDLRCSRPASTSPVYRIRYGNRLINDPVPMVDLAATGDPFPIVVDPPSISRTTTEIVQSCNSFSILVQDGTEIINVVGFAITNTSFQQTVYADDGTFTTQIVNTNVLTQTTVPFEIPFFVEQVIDLPIRYNTTTSATESRQTIRAVLTNRYIEEDENGRNSVDNDIVVLGECSIMTLGYNVEASANSISNAISIGVRPGAGAGPLPNDGDEARGNCVGALRYFLGATPNGNGAIRLDEGPGFQIVEEPGRNQITFVTTDPASELSDCPEPDSGTGDG